MINLIKSVWTFLFSADPHAPRIAWLFVILLFLLQHQHNDLLISQIESQQNIIRQNDTQQQQKLSIIDTTVSVLLQENLKRQEVKRQLGEFLQKNCSKSPDVKTKVPVIKAYVMYASDLFDIRPQLIAEILVAESTCDSKAKNNDGSKGLMQVHPVHKPDVFTNDFENIIKGVAILKDCLDKWGNIETKALACYKGVKNIK